MHIPKTAGTTLVSALDGLYLPEDRVHLYDLQPDAIHPKDFPSLPEEQRRRLRFVAGHFAYGLHEWIPRPCVYVTVLRDPVDRIRSLYDHYRNWQQSGDWHRWIVAEQVDLERFVVERPSDQTDNQMVRWLSGTRARVGRCTEEMLEIAKRRLDSFLIVIFHEDIERGASNLAAALGVSLPPIGRENVAPERSLVPESVTDVIRERNALDVKLYEYARSRHLDPSSSMSSRPGPM